MRWMHVLMTLSLLTACDEESVMEDAGTVCVPPDPFVEGAADGVAAPLGAGPTEVRAGRLGAADLAEDPSGLSTARAGDFVLANSRIAVVIEDVGASDGFDPWGGKPVAIARVEGGALFEPADFHEIVPMLGRFIPNVTSVGVLRDGSDGEAAVIRAIGVLEPIPAFDVLFGDLLSDDYGGVEVAVDYTLEPDADRFSVDYSFRVTTEDSFRVRQALHMFFQAPRMPAYFPGSGFDPGAAPADLPWLGFVEEGATSFAVRSPSGPLNQVIELSGASIFSGPTFAVPACSVHTEPYAEVLVGGPGIDGLLAVISSEDSVPLRQITGVVTEASGAPAGSVRVIAETSDGWLTRTRSAIDGTWSLRVPDGVAATVSAWRSSTGRVGPLDVAATASGVDLTLAPVGYLSVRALDMADGSPIPARIQVLATDPPSPPLSFGEEQPFGSRLHVAFAPDGTARLAVPPGTHRVVVSRGYEWDTLELDTVVTADATVDVEAQLEHVVVTPNVLCGDFHIHTSRSLDSSDDARFKLAAAIADGVEIAVRTDHEWVADFEPIILDMGIERWAYGVIGLELTTFLWGHFGVFPLVVDDALPNGGSVPWVGRLAPEVLADARARTGPFGPAAVVINHPRTFGGLMNEGAYFEAAGYDAATGSVDRPELWDDSFRLLEAFNASDFDANFSETVTDWFSFLNAGRRVFVIGSSDSHQIRRTPTGYPRTCVELGVDDTAALRSMGAGALRDALLAGHAVVSGGVIIDAQARATGGGPGSEVTGAAATERVQVVVRAPPWIDVDMLRVYVDSVLTETIPIDASTTDPFDASIRLSGDVDVPVASGALGSWVVLVASGDATLEPVHPGERPFGVTNPIFFRR